MNLAPLVTGQFQDRYGEAPAHIVRAPGRVNLIGEHTDYNAGLALPMAIDREIWIALRPRVDRRVRLVSLAFAAAAEFSLDAIRHSDGWDEYLRGMAWTLQASGLPVAGWEGVLASDVPVGAGLSSSAAIELAAARAFCAVGDWTWDPPAMARAARKHENEWMGLQSGIMDQLISAVGQAGNALLIDFLDESYAPVPLPDGVVVVVMDTKVQRGLVESAYNTRVAECRQAAACFGVDSLRDVTVTDLKERGAGLEDRLLRRARHVVTENQRVRAAAEALMRGDSMSVGKRMSESHASLRDDYEVSCRELDAMVAVAQRIPGCLGARMTGAGFGGCAVALVRKGRQEPFLDSVAAGYEEETGIAPELYVCRAVDGAEQIC